MYHYTHLSRICFAFLWLEHGLVRCAELVMSIQRFGQKSPEHVGPYRKRIYTEEKAKVVPAVWGTYLNAALAI